MPRTARFEELGLPHHVIVQGIERCPIFRDDVDRDAFVRRAATVFADARTECLAWALMDNHAHLVLRPTRDRLGAAMQRLLVAHARRFNLRHERVGRLFRDRFWSRPVEDDGDLAGLIGYVVLNPVRGGIVGDLDALREHPWTALRELDARPGSRSTLVDRAGLLSSFGDDERAAMARLSALLAAALREDPDGDEHARDEPAGTDCLTRRERIDLRAASVFALRLRSAHVDDELRRREGATALRLRLERRGWDVERTIDRAARVCGVRASRVRAGARRGRDCRARGLVAYFAGTHLQCTDADIGRATGVSRQAIVRARTRTLLGSSEMSLCWRRFFEIDDPVEADLEATS
jgi:REP element-mobilizing transposase RayT